MIHFKTITLEQKELYESYLQSSTEHGCEYTFGNLFMWGLQQATVLHDHIVLFSEFDNHCFYPFPIGTGDKKMILDAIFADAKERGLCPCLTGLTVEDQMILEELYPQQFYFHADRGNYDYVYNIHDLADLKGRKLHRKRNHLKHFKKNHPDYTVEPICEHNLNEVRDFLSAWYKNKLEEHPEGDYHNEQAALEKALLHFHTLKMEGLLLKEHGEILGFTMASQKSADTYDVHFEKAWGHIDGAYTTINSEFANYIRNKYPNILYLNREEDMGIAGLRKAKQSYFPHHLVKKYRAIPLRHKYSFQDAASLPISTLRDLWKEAFSDKDFFLDSFFCTAFHVDHCRTAMVNNELAAVLYWFDCSVNGQKLAYIYAVATAEKYRGNGLCHILLADTHRHLKELGYKGSLLVPGSEALIGLYEGAEYELCTKIDTISCTSENKQLVIRKIDKHEYAALRRQFLPRDSVLQENDNLDFLNTQASFYAGENFLLCAAIEKENLYGIELLGDTSLAPGILYALDCQDGTFRTPGKETPFAMYHALTEDAVEPSYFGFAFD